MFIHIRYIIHAVEITKFQIAEQESIIDIFTEKRKTALDPRQMI